MKKLETLKPEIRAILKRIQDSVPKEWSEKLTVRKPVAPTIKEAYIRAINDPNVNDELKRKAQIILDSGLLDKEVEVINKRYETYISRFIDKEIEASIRRGELPKKRKNVGKIIKEKIKHEKRSNPSTD